MGSVNPGGFSRSAAGQWATSEGIGSNRSGRPQVIGTRLQVPRSLRAAAGASSLQSETRIRTRIGPEDATSIQIGYMGWWDAESGGTGEQDLANALIIKGGVEITSPQAMTFKQRFAGADNMLMPAGSILTLCDPIPATLKANSYVFIRSSAKVIAGEIIPVGERPYVVTDVGFLSDGAASQVWGTGAMSLPSGGSAGDGWGPGLIIGIPTKPIAAVMCFGDSLISGTGDNAMGDGAGNIGYAGRALGNIDGASNAIPYGYISRAGNRLLYEDYNPSYRKRRVFQYFTHALCNIGVNDVSNGASVATMQAQYLRLWKEFKAAGLHVTQLLLTTKTTGAWTAPGGSDQTVPTAFQPNGVCDQINTWIATQVGLGLLDTILDPRPYFQVAATNKVIPGNTPDGTHYTATVHAAIAAGLIVPWAQNLTVPPR